MNIHLYSIHGLVRGSQIELGRDADTGGQVKYVVELARALSRCPEVDKVSLFTRKIVDSSISQAYSAEIEELGPNAQIVRIACGPVKYLRKELLWPHLKEFAERAIRFTEQSGKLPTHVHGHYVDGGIVAKHIAEHLNVPLFFTAHSLGKPKLRMLLEQGISHEEANTQFAIDHRITQEQTVLDACDQIIASTRHEVEVQYGEYRIDEGKIAVIAPGMPVDRFYPFNTAEYANRQNDHWEAGTLQSSQSQAIAPRGVTIPWHTVHQRLNKLLGQFLNDPQRPMILSICRPDRRKNLSALVELYGESKELQRLANLVIVAGNRNDVRAMPEHEREVFTDLLMSMDRYNLYGKLALPKRHCSEKDVPELLRIAAKCGGVFVNPAHFELFGLTSIEAAAVGLPFIATNCGGPVDVAQRTGAGIVVDVHNLSQFTAAIKLLLSDRDMWRRMSRSGIRSIREKYQWDTHCSKYLQAIHNVINPCEATPLSIASSNRDHQKDDSRGQKSKHMSRPICPNNNVLLSESALPSATARYDISNEVKQ